MGAEPVSQQGPTRPIRQSRFSYATHPLARLTAPGGKPRSIFPKTKLANSRSLKCPTPPATKLWNGPLSETCRLPTATYFVRAYALDANDHEVAYGQNTDAKKTTNLFEIQAISGRHVSLDIASVCFSVFSIVSLMGFFFEEKRTGRKAQQ
ncbi:hypothetical protein ERO13_A03G074850v2 [Gossypium hirsutum]|nr:hypothetical protein ERO13_A03G074850v2 [Gossypium hirsutum]